MKQVCKVRTYVIVLALRTINKVATQNVLHDCSVLLSYRMHKMDLYFLLNRHAFKKYMRNY